MNDLIITIQTDVEMNELLSAKYVEVCGRTQ